MNIGTERSHSAKNRQEIAAEINKFSKAQDQVQ